MRETLRIRPIVPFIPKVFSGRAGTVVEGVKFSPGVS